jgi:hypothetical protein
MDRRFFLTAATLALVAGCGDGACPFSGCVDSGPLGGSGGSGLMTLDQDNFLDAVREAWFAAMTTPGTSAFVEATGVGEITSGTVVVDPAGPTAYDCPASGTFLVSGIVADPDTVTAGDSVAYESSACDSDTGYMVDGVHSLDITSVVGDVPSGQFELAKTLSFTDFQGASPTLVTTLNGDHTAVIDTRVANTVTTAFSGKSLAIKEEQITVTMRNYSGSVSLQTIIPFGYTVDTGGNANSSVVVGSFDYWTNEPFEQLIGENPSNGILDVFGADNSTARLVVEDTTTVHVQLDANGSTNYEVSTKMTWDEFLGGLGGL